ncbi:MAG: SDR family NAD(P)-dependent oxidoreductase [Bacillota bacterium]
MIRDRAVLITGASGGIGRAAAVEFARTCKGSAHLFLVGRDAGRLKDSAAAVQDAGGCGTTPGDGAPAVTLLTGDVTQPAAVAQIAATVERTTGRLDVLVHCAGQLEVGPAEELGPTVAERLMRVNFLGAVNTIHACLPLLRRGRRPVIINVSSIAGRLAPPHMGAYAASKFALNAYSHSLRQELRKDGIRVCLVLPGPVDTAMVKGKIGGPFYSVPRGTPVLSPRHVAGVIIALADRPRREAVIPSWLTPGGWLGSAFPSVVDGLYWATASFRGLRKRFRQQPAGDSRRETPGLM